MKAEKNNVSKALYKSEDKQAGTGYCIYLVLSRPPSIVAKAIRVYTRDTYTHASISFDSSLSEMYTFSRKYSYYPFWGSLNCERFNSGFFKRCQHLPGIVIRVAMTACEYDKAKRLVADMFKKKQHYKYDMKGFFGNIFNFSIDSNTKFTCSKFVAYILRECGAAQFDLALSLVRPQTLTSVSGDIIYQGDLKKYCDKTPHSISTELAV